MPRIPKAAISEVIARTSGTTDATIAPNAKSRMMKVSGIVSRSDSSRPSEISALMSSLMNVLLMAWIARSGFAARAPSRIGRTGAIGPRPASPRPRSGRRSGPSTRRATRARPPAAPRNGSVELVEGRCLDAVERGAGRLEFGDDVTHRRRERRIAGRSGRSADDDDDLLERVVGPAGGEDVVGLTGLELPLVRVLVGIGRIDAAHRQADERTARS